ncbi:hypothetical protein CVU75_02065 [Candidatus Dependentiae bacterium HGW-Dependentiae-1]|nr:MAG: hypothetical protein CVU75_02065 [Candidatus Dependentiae bacterium HGW-Dependentiae-1]
MKKQQYSYTHLYLLNILAATITLFSGPSSACTHTDRQSSLSWTVPNQLCIENRDIKPLIVEGVAIQPGKSQTFTANDAGVLQIIYAKNVYKLAYPTCNDASNSFCSKKETTCTINTEQIKAAINRLQQEQKEVSWLHSGNNFDLTEKGPIDELCIINDTPFPVKVSTLLLGGTFDTEKLVTQFKSIEPGHTYQAVVTPINSTNAPQGRTRKSPSTQGTIAIDDTLGAERHYAINIMRRSATTEGRGYRAPQNNTITQVALAISTLQKIKSGMSIELLDSK